MTRDLRDPQDLGELLLAFRAADKHKRPLSKVADSPSVGGLLLRVADHNANPGTLEKYGRPQDLPPTPF